MGKQNHTVKWKKIIYENWHKSNINFVDDLLDATNNFKIDEKILRTLERFSRAHVKTEYRTILNLSQALER